MKMLKRRKREMPPRRRNRVSPLEHFTLEIVAYGGHSPPAPIPLQGFAGKSLQSRLTFSMLICSKRRRRRPKIKLL
jgi:hypothetical protein